MKHFILTAFAVFAISAFAAIDPTPVDQNAAREITAISHFIETLNLQEGDVVLSINGFSVKDPKSFLKLKKSLQDPEATTAMVAILRDGKKQTLTFSLK
jgi:type II secretory pathway component PulC